LFASVEKLRETHRIRLADDQVFDRAAGIHGATAERDLEAVRTTLGTTRSCERHLVNAYALVARTAQ
jgi:hypothetical protein